MEKLINEIDSIVMETQQITKQFQKGDEVEVTSHKLGFVGSYYEATIVSIEDANHYRVKYKTLLTDDQSAPLEELVPIGHVRPVSSHQLGTTSENRFRQYDKVDVFSSDGWWFGFISGIIEENYYVHFPTTGQEVAYPSHALRFHQEWSNDDWEA
ncbi:protein AGENET DOMAIN (AGD)-CONTAINING P1-like [Solanum lycopersicum]|uniref:Agenet domain-containing protein n=1 Tax=Solanum lycopersicum TaxID=4081 RepID=A0A3Q7H1H6_SOLLC|nr:DUF724 domain-containing protein 3-like [Solanum lycopersicum]